MSAVPEDNRRPEERVTDSAAMVQAITEAVREALLDHKRAGNPVAFWRDGQVVWVQPEDIPV